MAIRKKRKPVKETKQQRNKKVTSFSYCYSCGKKLIQHVAFCPHCGSPLNKTTINKGISIPYKQSLIKNLSSSEISEVF